MLNVRSFGHINIVVPNVDEAEKYYSEIFAAKLIASLPHFKNEGMNKNMNIPSAEVSVKILKFTRCNIVLSISQYYQGGGSQELPKYNINDMGGPRHVGLHVDNIEAAFDALKARSDVEILNTPDFRPVNYSPLNADQFQMGSEEINQNQTEKNKLAELLSKKKCFFFRDKYGVIWEIEERYYADNE